LGAVAGCRWRGAFDARLAHGVVPRIDTIARRRCPTRNKNQRMEAPMHAKTEKAQIRRTGLSSAYWRITFDNPPLNVMGPQFVHELAEIISDVEADKDRRVLVFRSAVEGFFLNHSDFNAD